MQGFDWYRYAVGGAASREDSFSKLNPQYAQRVASMIAAADQELGPQSLRITSAYRSPDLQAKLFADAVNKYGSESAARKWVAPPGKSRHNFGLAVDFADASGKMLRDPNSREAKWIAENAARFGLAVPMSWEPWQVELPRDQQDAAMAGGTFTGGGGSGTMVGGAADDTLSGGDIDMNALLAWANGQQAGQPAAPADQPAKPTLAEVYNSTGALDVAPAGDIDMDALLSWANQAQAAPQSPVDEAAYMAQQQQALALGLGAEDMAARGMSPEQIAAAQSENLAAFNAAPKSAGIRGSLSKAPFAAASGFLDASAQAGAGQPLKQLGNVAMAGLAGLTGAGNYAVGSAADLAAASGLVSEGSAKSLARDIVAMPEAFAGSPNAFAGMPTQIGRSASVPSTIQGVASTASRVEPQVKRAVQTAAVTADDVQTLLRQAQKRGGTSRQAIRKLAAIAKVDPDAAAAAERLGIDLPADVFSTNTAVIETAGAIRGVKAGEAANEFLDGVRTAQTKADAAMATLDGGASIADVSETVLGSLRGTQSALKSQADELYGAIDAKVPKSAPVETNATAAVLSQTMDDLGGVSRMTAQEKTLVTALTNADEPLTYAGMVRLKQDIGRALERGQGPYADVNQATLKRLYGALAEDQVAAVKTIGGDDLAASLQAANGLVSQRKALEESIVGAFGRDMEGSIATKLRTAVTSASKGDLGNLNRILNVIPPELHKQAVATAIGDLATTTRGSAPGQFSFEGFSKTYQGLRANPPVYKRIAEAVGPEGHALMEDLYRVSTAVSRAKAAIPMTGKANQILDTGALRADGLIGSVMNTTVGKTAVRATTTGAFGAVGGLPAAIAADSVGAALTMGRKDRVAAAGRLLSSEPFKAMAIEIATKPAVAAKTRNSVLNSPAFQSFVKASGIKDPQAWLAVAVAGGMATQTEGNAQ